MQNDASVIVLSESDGLDGFQLGRLLVLCRRTHRAPGDGHTHTHTPGGGHLTLSPGSSGSSVSSLFRTSSTRSKLILFPIIDKENVDAHTAESGTLLKLFMD